MKYYPKQSKQFVEYLAFLKKLLSFHKKYFLPSYDEFKRRKYSKMRRERLPKFAAVITMCINITLNMFVPQTSLSDLLKTFGFPLDLIPFSLAGD